MAYQNNYLTMSTYNHFMQEPHYYQPGYYQQDYYQQGYYQQILTQPHQPSSMELSFGIDRILNMTCSTELKNREINSLVTPRPMGMRKPDVKRKYPEVEKLVCKWENKWIKVLSNLSKSCKNCRTQFTQKKYLKKHIMLMHGPCRLKN